jgi:ADP-ribose pyrophosphatase
VKVWEGKRFSVLVENGKEIVDTPEAVAILAVDGDGRIVLVRQHRPAAGTDVLELPAGLVDEGEEPLATARRELREETGLHGGSWRELASFWSSPGFQNERVTVFAAEDVEEGEPQPDQGEELEVVRWTRADLESQLTELVDGTTLVGLLLYLRETD